MVTHFRLSLCQRQKIITTAPEPGSKSVYLAFHSSVLLPESFILFYQQDLLLRRPGYLHKFC